MQAPQDQSNEAQLSPPYVAKILKQINPQYFKIPPEKESSTKSPQFIINNPEGQGKMTRILDKLPNGTLFTPQEIDAFLQNFLSFGDDYALAQTLNPLLSEIIDFKNQTLKQSFIDRHLGEDNYTKLCEKLDDKVIAKGFCDAIKVLFSNIINDKFNTHPLYMMYILQAGVRNSYSQSEDQSGIIKLYDNKKKYYFCQQMSEDIQKFASLGSYKNKNSIIDQQLINDEFEHYSSSSEFMKFIKSEENKQKVLAQLWFSALLNDLNELKKDSKNNAQLIEEIQSLIQKYDYDNYEHQLNRRAKTIALKLAVSIIATLLLVALVVLIAIAVFASGGAAASPIIIPYISNIYGFAVSAFLAFIGFGISIYLDYKYGTNNQAIKEFEDKKASENSMVSGPDSTQAITNALGPKSSHDENSPRASDELEEKDGQLSSSSTPVNENQHDSPSAPSLPGTVNRGIDDDNASPSSGPSSGR